MFDFKETSPFSENFAEFDMQDMNFFMNTGSVILLICLIFFAGLAWRAVHYIAKALY